MSRITTRDVNFGQCWLIHSYYCIWWVEPNDIPGSFASGLTFTCRSCFLSRETELESVITVPQRVNVNVGNRIKRLSST